jgi:hypothetical protein
MAEKPPIDGMVRIWGFRCLRCEHEWVPRNKEQAPKVCPNPACKSPYWDRPRVQRPIPGKKKATN